MTLNLRRCIILTHFPLLALLLIIAATGVVLLYRLGTRAASPDFPEPISKRARPETFAAFRITFE